MEVEAGKVVASQAQPSVIPIRSWFGPLWSSASDILLFPKLLYFTYWGAFAFARPFFPIFYEYVGLSRGEIGILTGLPPFIVFCASPAWTALADRFHKHKWILVVNSLISTVIIYLQSLTTNFWIFIPIVLSFAVATAPLTALIDSSVLLMLKDDKNLYGRQRLWGAVSWGIAAFVSGALLDKTDIRVLFFEYIVTILVFASLVAGFMTQWGLPPPDNNTNNNKEKKKKRREQGEETEMEALYEEEDEEEEGGGGEKGRDTYPENQKEDEEDNEMVTITFHHEDDLSEESEEARRKRKMEEDEDTLEPKPVKELHQMTFREKLLILFLNKSLILFFVSVFVMGMGAAIIQNFLFLYLETSLGATKTLMGLSLTFTVLVEIPFFFFSKYLLEKLGMRGMIILAHVCYIIRVVAYTMLPNAWAVLPFELLHGTTFAAMWAAGVAYANSKAPPGLEATAQGLFTGVYTGLGQGVGAVVGGSVYQHFGPVVMFVGAAVVVGSSLVFFIVTQWLVIDGVDLSREAVSFWRRYIHMGAEGVVGVVELGGEQGDEAHQAMSYSALSVVLPPPSPSLHDGDEKKELVN